MRNEPRHVEYFCRCSACRGDIRAPRLFYENSIFSPLWILRPQPTGLDGGEIGTVCELKGLPPSKNIPTVNRPEAVRSRKRFFRA